MNQFTANWNYPTSVRSGIDRIHELADACKELGISSPLLVTDPGLAQLPLVEKAVELCMNTDLNCKLFTDIKGNPTGKNISDGVAAYKTGHHDGIIALGGGSALDAGKAIALMAGQSRSLWSFEDVGDNWLQADADAIAPIVAIPTTAGTGSEVGRASVITDEENQLKRIIFHPKMLPGIVILDARLTSSLPAKITAATGMDALSHNLEAFCSPFYHPMAQGIALEGIRLVKEYLPRAVANGSDLEARSQMIVASSMGATAFQKGLGGMHALAHPLGALYDAHHGLLNAVLMPYVLKANREAIETDITRLAKYLLLEDCSFDGFLNWILNLRREIGIPNSLGEIGIDEEQLEKVGLMATEDPSASGNPITFIADQYTTICRKAIRGEL
ncbi:iron-containing alcohol dehydrogenase [Sansalvadorimonas sp. 2012CJ34-2]|uniref:Iron-containing alcohol dehydrogenase n=1 Tax=Parendozoicomonas callyspongiae TaxID=2942213 RepID=A0ABT0PEE5_9GAMM|nr:iron-containing alcohol dehydrogenase [Sansalvadorimonas sp. 2012CJ34-2]MCL6269152.1 iron-containing alcohol dehydrogenase [Sansalvadorimonas sp. 2012CJ34-2]